MTSRPSIRPEHPTDARPDHIADTLSDTAALGATPIDAAPADAASASTKPKADDSDRPAMAQPTTMDYQAGFTSGR